MKHYLLLIVILSSLIAQVDYSTQIQPIFDNNCTSCHVNGGTYSGGLDLSSYAETIEGGNSGNTVVPSDHSNSVLYNRITLPESDQQFMPKNGSPLSQSDIDLIVQWIDEGALETPVVDYSGPVWYVETNGSDETGDGSEASPFATIQKGIDLSNDGDTILVANGVYNQIAALYDTSRSLLIASHYIIDNNFDHIANTVIDFSNNLDGWYFHMDSLFVTGFLFENYIQAYNVLSDSSKYFNLSSSFFKDNSNGIYLTNGTKVINNCTFTNNGKNISEFDYSGAVFVNSQNTNVGVNDRTTYLTMVNCDFYDNISEQGGGLLFRGEVGYVDSCNFFNNQADLDAGGGINYGDGGAIANYPETDANNVLHITNSLFVNNYAYDDGGAIATAENLQQSIAETNVINCTFINNSSLDKGNAFYLSFGSDVTIKNSIITGLSSIEFLDYGSNINQNLSIDFSSVEGGEGSILGYQSDYMSLSYENSFDLEIVFCDALNNDYSLPENSPAVGAGENSTNIGALGVGCESLLIDKEIIPEHYTIYQNYPNPFNPITSLRYDLPEDGLVNITIYDMMGRIVKTLVNNSQNAGYKSIKWNGKNDRNEPVPAGMYIYTIQVGEFRQTRKMVLLK